MKKWYNSLVFLFLALGSMVLPTLAAEGPAVVVGRVFQIEGDLLRYVPDEKDWVAVVKDAPFGTGDTLYSGTGGMAELAAPNGSWIRLGNSTQLQFIDLETDLAETDVASGIARFYNKGSRTVIKATSPYGYVLADPGTAFDFYVGENSVEVVAVKGEVSFVHSATGAKYDVAAGSTSILADQNQVSSGEGGVDPGWDQWNNDRENFWSKKARVRGRSIEYLPPNLRDESYTLEENGRWEMVPYEGRPCWFWRPTSVAAGWSPFTMGRWTDWNRDQTWIPSEPFGYVTHHYGNWVNVHNNWYWAPPVARAQINLPLLNVGFSWNPGRVSWIHSGSYVGWVPLAPRETYFSYRNWGGPHGTVVNNVNVTRININVRNYAYANHAVVVNQSNFYGVNNYRNVRVTNINNTTIINNYRAAPVVNNTVINNYGTNRQRFNYSNRPVNQKPHNSVINRIQRNETIIRKDTGRRENAAIIQQQVKRIPEGRINRESRVALPKITNHIVPAKEVNRPKAEIRFQQKEIKRHGERAPETRPGQFGRPQNQPGRPEQVRPERVQPAQPAQQGKPGRTGEPGQVTPPVNAQPVNPGQFGRPRNQPQRSEQVRPERVQPAQPAQQVKPGQTREPERVTPPVNAQPVNPGQFGRPRNQPQRPEQVRPERVQPAQPAQQVKPGQTREPERVTPPVNPGQFGRPRNQPQRPEQVRPERVQPVQQDKPGRTREPERVTTPVNPQPVNSGQFGRPQNQPQRPEQVRPERVQPAQPAQQVKPGRTREPERVTTPVNPQPVNPGQFGRPRNQPQRPEQVRPERVQPAQPAQQEKPGQTREPVRVTPPVNPQPVNPGQFGRPRNQPQRPEQVRPERVKPAQPAQQEKPGRTREPVRVTPPVNAQHEKQETPR